MRTLVLVTAGYFPLPLEELERLEASGATPRVSTVPLALHGELLDEHFLRRIPLWRRLVYKPLPMWLAQVFEAFLQSRNYDAVVSWGAERIGLPFALLLRVTGSDVPYVAIWSWISKPRQALLLKHAHSHIDRLILPPSRQREIATKVLRVPPQKVVGFPWGVDLDFWHPMGGPQDMICAAGREMRDYTTLIEALRGLDIRCHIAANIVPGRRRPDSWVRALEHAGPLPSHITIGPKTPEQLRELYARSRFVVIPLLPSDTDNGVTAILEAMAMGRAVICSRTDGQRDVIQEGETGLYVTPGDVDALRDCIRHSWMNPHDTARMGNAARKCVEKQHSLDQFVRSVRHVVEEVVRDSGRRRTTPTGRRGASTVVGR